MKAEEVLSDQGTYSIGELAFCVRQLAIYVLGQVFKSQGTERVPISRKFYNRAQKACLEY